LCVDEVEGIEHGAQHEQWVRSEKARVGKGFHALCADERSELETRLG